MVKDLLTFGNIEIEKNNFFCHKSPIVLKDIDTEKVLVSKKIYVCYVCKRLFLVFSTKLHYA